MLEATHLIQLELQAAGSLLFGFRHASKTRNSVLLRCGASKASLALSIVEDHLCKVLQAVLPA